MMKRKYTFELLISLLLITVKAFSYDFQSGGIYYNITDGNSVEVRSGNSKYEGNIVIPEKVKYNGKNYSVTSIGNWVFLDCSGLKDIVSEIKTPFEINQNVFSVYSTAKLTVPKGTKSAYQSTNYWNKFTNILESTNNSDNTGSKQTIHVAVAGTLPNLISESEKYTIEELTLTGELNGTDFRLLRDMAGNNYLGENTSGKLAVLDLTNVKVVAGGEKYLATAHGVYGNGIIAGGSFHLGISNSNAIPESVFYGCYLKEIHIPNSVMSIGNYAFSYCRGLTSIIIPNSVTSIGSAAFSGCSGLTSISIPNSVTSIGNSAFIECSGLTSISIPNSVTSIDDGAFYGCSGLSSIKVESGNNVYDSRNNCNAIIKKSNNELIAGCKNTVIPNSVTSIGISAFSECSGLTSISIPNSVTSIGDGAFSDCSGLTSISIPNSVTSIGGGAFYGCSGLTSISIPNSVTSIGDGAFYYCSGLTSISIPNSVTSIGYQAFYHCSKLAAIIWNPEAEFTEKVNNPNLLLYVTKAQYAPSSIKNVVVNGSANSITLTDAASGNDFYCPQEFTAQRISYTHNYEMKTGIGNAQGWETIALPFDVQKVTHQSKGEIVSFAKWKSGDAKKPFWLMELSSSGWKMAESIKANTPYIISMPNNEEYKSGFLLNGSVTFSAENVNVAKTENLSFANYSDRTFVPTFACMEKSNDVFALNVVNDIERFTGGSTEGSIFERNLRVVHPFEAYMTSTSSTRSIGIDEGMATDIIELISAFSDEDCLRIYNLNGQLIKMEEGRNMHEVMKSLPAGIYIVNGKKVIIK